MPRVMVKGFGEVDLPDGMSQEQMRLALRQMYPTSARQSATDALTPMPSKPMQVEPDMYSRPEVSLRDYLTGVGDTAESFARGAAQGSLGVLGDLQDLGQSAYQEVTSDNPSFGGFVDRLGTNETIFPTAGDVGGYIDSVFGENKPEVLSQEGADIASFGGELIGMPLGAAKVPAVAKAVKDAPISLLDAVAQGPSARSPLSQRGAIGVRVQNTPDQEITASKSGNLGPGVYLYEKSTPELADKLINRGMYNKVSKGGDPYSLELEYDDNLNLYETSNKILSDNQVRQLKDAGFDGVRRVVDGVPQEVNIFDPSNVRFPSDESVSEASGLFDQLGDDALYKFSNINPEYIETIDELGGLPSPSIGIAKVGDPISNFGEIGLIGRMDSFDSDPTFAADVYSPRQPKPDIDLPEDSVLGEQARLRQEQPEIAQAYGIPRFDRSSDPVDAARGEPSIIAEFAQSKGIDVSPQAQTTVTSNFEKMESLFGSSLELDEGITDSLSNQAKKYFASNLPPKPPENASKIRKKKYNDKLELYKAFFDDGQLNDLGYEVLKNEYDVNKAKSVFDKNTAARNLKDQFREQGLEGEFEQFIQDKVKSMNPQKSLFDTDYFYNTGERRSLEYNMDNILKAMNKQDVRGGEGFGGVGGTRALVTPRLKTIKDIKDNRGRIITGGEFNDITSDMGNLTADLQDYLIKESPELEDVFDGYNTFHEEIAEYIKGNPSAFDNISGESKGAVDLYLKELEDMPTEYFEAKPRRAVELSEFYGAVVPKGTSRKVTAPLENAGLKIEYYDPEKGRTGAIKNLHKSSGGQIMFSAGGIAFLTTGDDEQETEL